ncbi:MAG: hypothetical protein IJU95_05420, partial [Treponema sp.]|nr:hypothetical protein [Treponema sp.]
MASKQDVVFILEEAAERTDVALWSCIRQCIHSLRGYAFSKKRELSIAFATLSSGMQEETDKKLSFVDFNSFSIKERHKDSYFSQAAFPALNYYFGTRSSSADKLAPLVIVMHKGSLENSENYVRLSSSVYFRNARVICSAKNDWASLPSKIYRPSSGILPFTGASGTFSGNRTVKRLLVGTGVAIATAIALMLSAPYLSDAWENHKEIFIPRTYKKVYTGDSDRLIMRTEADAGAEELIRLNEGEVVESLEPGDEWEKVVFHGFEGYVHSEYLVPSSKEEYVLVNPDTMYTYGKACLQRNFVDMDGHDGYWWIEQAAANGELTAQWEMYRFYENGSFPSIERNPEKALEYLRDIDLNAQSVEEKNIVRYREMADKFESSSQKELAEKLSVKADEKERDIKAVRRQAEKRLSELSFDDDIDAASEYYKKAMDLGLDGDADYMYSLAEELGSDDEAGIYWLKEASDRYHFNASYKLGNYYFHKRDDHDSALTYFLKASSQGYGA